MVRRFKFLFSIPLAFLCFIQLLVASPALSGLTLCIGEEGPIGFEADQDECCAPRADSFADASLVESRQDADCCINVAFGEAMARHQAVSAVQSAGAFFAVPLVLELLVHSHPESNPYANSIFPVNTSLTAIQSVVLRV